MKNKQLVTFEKQLKDYTLYLSECKNLGERTHIQAHINFCTEVINSLGAKEQSSKHL